MLPLYSQNSQNVNFYDDRFQKPDIFRSESRDLQQGEKEEKTLNSALVTLARVSKTTKFQHISERITQQENNSQP